MKDPQSELKRKKRNLGFQIARKYIFNTLSDCRSIACTLLIYVIFFSEYQLRIPPFNQVCLYFFVYSSINFFLRGVLRKSWQERYMQLAFMYVFRCLSQRVRRIGGKCGKSWTWSKINPHFVTFSICYTEATIKRCKNCGDQNPS